MRRNDVVKLVAYILASEENQNGDPPTQKQYDLAGRIVNLLEATGLFRCETVAM